MLRPSVRHGAEAEILYGCEGNRIERCTGESGETDRGIKVSYLMDKNKWEGRLSCGGCRSSLFVALYRCLGMQWVGRGAVDDDGRKNVGNILGMGNDRMKGIGLAIGGIVWQLGFLR